MDSETPQTEHVPSVKEVDSNDKPNEDKAPENDQTETEGNTALAAGTEGAQGGEGHGNKSDSDTAAEMEVEAGDLVTAAPTMDDTEEPKGEKKEGDSSPQAERDTDASEEAKKDEDTVESDPQKPQSESEKTDLEKVPLDMDGESGEEKEKEEGLQYKVRFEVSGDSSTEAAGEEAKVDPTAAAATDTDTEPGVSTPIKNPLPSTESERGKEPAWYSRTSLLITSVFSIFCFFPMGIVALYYGMKVKDAYHSKYEEADIKDYARKSTFCSIAAITTGIIALLLILVVTILGITGVRRSRSYHL